ncbi:Serine-threonine/tyrosine-protein kinase, catalytic domain [Sesbania bispinosa]|nr:Serine-threonine/tyrosine-protein kinase, catalytic domain [Sesbania bispinosa]
MCVCWTTCIHVSAANDSLKPGETLDTNITSKLCSKKVWTANRNQPVDPDSAVLLLDHSGVLKIESKDAKPIILYSPPQTINNTVATLLDTGNFVLQQLHPNGMKSMLWQSFDYPTDSLLPGMKLGVSHKTAHNWSLVSWFSRSLPYPGPFRLDWEPKRRELVISKNEQVYWRSGELRNNRFEHVSAEDEAQYSTVSNKDEEYFTFTTPKEELTKWTLLETGQMLNRKGNDIARADMCYGYNTDGGCQKWEEIPTCRGHDYEFEFKAGLPQFTHETDLKNVSYGISDCQAICWSNCSCIGFASLNDNGTGCMLFQSMEGTNIAGGGESFYMLVKKTNHKDSEKSHKGKSGTTKWKWIIAAIATALLIVCLSIICRALMKRKYVLQGGSSSGNNLEVEINDGDDLKVFSYATIMEATNGFSSENKLGQGGFGPVFKGILSSGQEVAVKKLSKTSGQGVIEFKNELTLISKLQHTNLVQLLGHCIHEQERMLVYEYMANKSLDFFLFDSSGRKLLDWNKRFSIIEGIAQGLLYLHKYSRLRIIHRDLKASNILLDENMNPKISDFGVARMFTKHESEANTNRIVGT